MWVHFLLPGDCASDCLNLLERLKMGVIKMNNIQVVGIMVLIIGCVILYSVVVLWFFKMFRLLIKYRSYDDAALAGCAVILLIGVGVYVVGWVI